jgi:FkbM family methyltransferase
MSTNSVNDSATHELENVLSTSILDVQKWEENSFDNLIGKQPKSFVLFGAGGLGRKTLAGLRKLGNPPVAFTDNNRNLYGHEVDGVTVLSPEQAAHHYGEKAIFIITIYMDSAPGGIEPIIKKLIGLKCRNIISFLPLYWKYPDLFLPHYVYDLPYKIIASADHIRNAWNLFNDKLSKEEFLAQIKWRLNPNYDNIPNPASHTIYFPPDLIKLNKDEVFIDCGAYQGDTIRSILIQTNGSFQKLLTFEPDPINYLKLSELVSSFPPDISQRIKTSDLAIGRRSELLHFNAQGAASSSLSDNGEIVIRSEALDTLLIGETPTFIKMDIEGAEIDAIEGATETIRAQLPILAISAYHRQEHIWEIPLLIHSISQEYKFFLRRYHERILDDLVLYAIPNNRLLNKNKSSF